MVLKSLYKIEWLITAVAAVLFFQCGRMSDSSGMKGDWMTCRSDSICVDVFVPDVSWSRSMAIWPISSEPVSGREEGMSQLVTQYLYRELMTLKGVRVLAPRYLDMDYLHHDHIDYLLKGEIRESDSRIMVTLRLVDVAGDTNIWAGTYIEDMASLPDIGKKAGYNVARTIGIRKKKGKDSSADELSGEKSLFTVQGDFFRMKRTPDDAAKATEAYLKALETDSLNTAAWIGLASNYLDTYQMRGHDKLIWINLVQKAVSCAMNREPDLADGHVLLGRSFLCLGDWKQAESAFRKALTLNPNQYPAWKGLARVFLHFGLYDPASAAFQKVLLLNPADTTASLGLVMIKTGMGQYKEAEHILLDALKFNPDQSVLNTMLALVYHYQNEPDRAFVSVYRGMASTVHHVYPHAVLAILYAKQGSDKQAINEINEYVEPYAVNDSDLAMSVAAVYSLLGKEDHAMYWLEKAVTLGYTEYPWLIHDEDFSTLFYNHQFGQFLDSLQSVYESQMLSYQMNLSQK